MLIDAKNLATHSFTLARTKDSVDASEVAAFLKKIEISIQEANGIHKVLQSHAESQAAKLAAARARIAKLEEIPTPTQAQVKTIELAHELHERYVGEGHAAAATIVDEAHTEAERILDEARVAGNRILEDVSDKKNTVERRIEKLSQFERDNWLRIQAFLQGQISNLGTKIPENLIPPTETETAGMEEN